MRKRPGGGMGGSFQKGVASLHRRSGRAEERFWSRPALLSGWGERPAPPAEEDLEEVLSLTVLSLTALGLNRSRFLVIKDPELRERIQPFLSHPSPLSPSGTLIVVCARLDAEAVRGEAKGWQEPEENLPAQGWNSPDRARNKEEAMFFSGLATQVLILAAKALHYDCRLIPTFDPEGIARLIHLPPNHEVAMLLEAVKSQPVMGLKASAPIPEKVVLMNRF